MKLNYGQSHPKWSNSNSCKSYPSITYVLHRFAYIVSINSAITVETVKDQAEQKGVLQANY